MQIFDTHTHLDFESFDEDRHEVLRRFSEVGGQALMIAGVEAKHFARIIEVINDNSSTVKLFGSFGLHPMFHHGEDDLSKLESALQKAHESICALGEIGLDKHGPMAHERQLELLEHQLQVAQQFKLPVILHCRGRHNELLQALDRYPPPCGGVVHAFSGSESLAMDYIKRGLSIGVGGVITYERAAKTRKTVSRLPLSSIVLETDSPDMPLDGYQGTRNEPSRITEVLKTLTSLRQTSVEAISTTLYENAERIFGEG